MGRAGRSHCNIDILLPQPRVLAPFLPDSLHRMGAGIQHPPLCIRPALAACLQCNDFKTVLKKVGRWGGEPISLHFFPSLLPHCRSWGQVSLCCHNNPSQLFNLTIEELGPGKQSLFGTVLTHMFKGTNLHHSFLTWELSCLTGEFSLLLQPPALELFFSQAGFYLM